MGVRELDQWLRVLTVLAEVDHAGKGGPYNSSARESDSLF